MPCQNGSPCALNPLAVLSCGNEVCHQRSFLRDPPIFAAADHQISVSLTSRKDYPRCVVCEIGECETEFAERALQLRASSPHGRGRDALLSIVLWAAPAALARRRGRSTPIVRG